jgi:ribosomal protein L7/L12
MPSDFHCNHCDLRFSVGWFHYHDFRSGYGAQTLLVCTQCGVQHSLEIALEDRGPEFREKFDVELTAFPRADRFEALRLVRRHIRCTNLEAGRLVDDLPLRLAEKLWPHERDVVAKSVESTGIVLTFTVAERIPNEGYGPLQADRLLVAKQPRSADDESPFTEIPLTVPRREDGSIDLARQQCGACLAVGTLTHEFESFAPCPTCKHPELERTGAWIT